MIQIISTRVGANFLNQSAKHGYGWKFSDYSLGKGGHYDQDSSVAITYSGRIDLIELPELLIGPIAFDDSEVIPFYDVDKDTPILKISLLNLELLLTTVGEVSNLGIYLTHNYHPTIPNFTSERILYGIANFPLSLMDRIEAELIF